MKGDNFQKAIKLFEKKGIIKPQPQAFYYEKYISVRSSDFWVGIGIGLFFSGIGAIFSYLSIYVVIILIILGVSIALYSRFN